MKRILKRFDSEMTPLVAYGCIAISVILVFTLLSNFSNSIQDKQQELATAKSELATLAQLQGDDVWTRRLEQSEKAKAQINRQLWQGTTHGVISADLEQNLQRLATSSGMQNIGIKIDQAPETVGDIEVMYFDLRGQLKTSADAIKFLSQLTQTPRRIIISDTNFSLPRRQNSSISLNGYIPVKTTTEPVQ